MANATDKGPQIGPQVRRLRKQKGWSRDQLGVYAGISPSTVMGIESGRRNASSKTLDRLARTLDVEVQDLFPKDQALESPPDVDEGPYKDFQRLLEELDLESLMGLRGELGVEHKWAVNKGDTETARDIYRRLVLVGNRLDELDPPTATVTIRRNLPPEVVFHREPTEEELIYLQDRYPGFITVLKPEDASQTSP